MSTAQVEDAEASLETMLQDLYPSELKKEIVGGNGFLFVGPLPKRGP